MTKNKFQPAERVDLANTKFVGFTYERLVKREQYLSSILADPKSLDIEIAEAALNRIEVRACKQLFESLNLQEQNVTVADILETVMGQPLHKLQTRKPKDLLINSTVKHTATVTKSTVTATKSVTNKLATWLANKTKTTEGGQN